MRKQYFSFIFLYIFSSCLYSQTMDDNIIINCCEDSYVFKEGPGDNPIVQNTRKTEYEALRMGATVQPHMFYGLCAHSFNTALSLYPHAAKSLREGRFSTAI